AVIALTTIIVGLAVSLFMREIWQFVALWGVLIGVGSGLTAMVLGATIATRGVSQRRVFVMGFLSATNATGQLVFQPMLAQVTETFGWRATVSLICAILAVAGVAIMLLMRDRPADIGQPPYGEKNVTPAPVQQSGPGPLLASPLMILRDAARVPLFWV